MHETAGIVLCGGQSSRMGLPKAWLPFAGETMLGRVVRLLSTVVAPVVVVAAPGQDVPPLPVDVDVVRDPERGLGPMQGLAAGLAAVAGRARAAYVSSCDVPFLQPDFVRRMVELLGENHIAVPDVGGYRHPLAAVYRVDVLDVVRQLVQEGRLRMAFLFDLVPMRFVSEEELTAVDPGLRTLRNLNTPEEYEAALRDVEGADAQAGSRAEQ
jgi:molybdopterin-guanine dinucleotide biosynthesis protein A